jgi:hypothetical protein
MCSDGHHLIVGAVVGVGFVFGPKLAGCNEYSLVLLSRAVPFVGTGAMGEEN